MIRNYFLVAMRNLIREKGYSFINIFGLAFGLAATLLIFIWVFDEYSYDRFHENIDRLYRVEQDQDYDGEAYHVNVTPYPAGEGFEQEVPEIERCVRAASKNPAHSLRQE
ncbi:MAG: ABC transporter permease [Bacteroidota bacterium]|nr:ABC transporter permease [Bacteroidota bacterium]